MYCLYKNSYLQLGAVVDPRIVNKAVRRAMRKTQFDPHDELPSAQRMTSMLPSLYAPRVDITRARLGFSRRGLRLLNKNILSEDNFTKLESIHTLMDEVQISENALFLINLNVVYRLIELLLDRDPIIREKVAITLTHLTKYYQGRARMLARPVIVDRLMFLFMRDRKEIRYAAALCLNRLTKHSCACEVLMKNAKIVENLLKMIKHDHAGIVLLHIKSLRKLTEWDPTVPLKANAFQVMMNLMEYQEDNRIQKESLNCLIQLCKHSVGQKLADKYDLTQRLRPLLDHNDLQVVISAVGLMEYTSVTSVAKWRMKEFSCHVANRLVDLLVKHDVPALQVRAMQVLINMCNCPDMRSYIKLYHWEKIKDGVKIRTHEQWDGTTDTTDYGLETGHNYRTRCIEDAETIRNDVGEPEAVNVHSYLWRVNNTKDRLLKMLNYKPYVD